MALAILKLSDRTILVASYTISHSCSNFTNTSTCLQGVRLKINGKFTSKHHT